MLDKTCCTAYKERIEKRPDYYINRFVRLGMISSSPYYNSIACDPFWKQIFKDKNKFEKFLKECEKNKIKKVLLVRNFWDIYKANNYHPIQFENQGNVQEKIDNGLVNEYNQLRKIKNIEKELSKMPDSKDISKDEKDRLLKDLRKMFNKLETELNLQINKRWEIQKSVKTKIKELEDNED